MVDSILIKLLWPFINETLLKNKPLREFIRANKLVLFLLLLNVLTGASSLYLYLVVNKIDNKRQENTGLIEQLYYALSRQADKLIEVNRDKSELQNINDRLTENNTYLLFTTNFG